MSDASPPPKRNLLVLSRPPDPLDAMSDTQIDAWVAKVYAGMKTQYERTTGAPADEGRSDADD